MDRSQDTILVIGGTGFLGSHIVDAFIATNRVVSISRNPSKSANINLAAEYIACNTTKQDQVAGIIDQVKPTVIIHTATPGPFASAHKHEADVAAVQSLLHVSAHRSFVRAFVYIGSTLSCANVSGLSKTQIKEEDVSLHTTRTALSAYELGKAHAERYVLGANGTDLKTVVFRMPAIYGERDDAISGGFLSIANTMATKVQLGPNKAVHGWVYAGNAAYACVLTIKILLSKDEERKRDVGGEAFFITDGPPIKVWDFARMLWAGMGDASQPRIMIPWWVVALLATICELLCRILTLGTVEPPFSRLHIRYMKDGGWFSTEKAQQRLGYEPLLDMSEGIRRTVAWWKERQRTVPQ